MAIHISTHLNFRGNARSALEFYKSVFGGDLVVVTYAEARSNKAEAEANHVMWGQVVAPNGFRVMAYDVPSHMPWEPGKNAFFVSVRGEGVGDIADLWPKLAAKAQVLVPLAPSAWSPLYGMLTDQFGITWVLDVATEYAAP